MRLLQGKEEKKQQENLKHSKITKILLLSSAAASVVIILYLAFTTIPFSFSFFPHAIEGSHFMYAALAAQCTNDQRKFWQFHNILYDNQKPIDSGWVSKDNLKKFASQIVGLNMQQFEVCFDSKKYKDFIESDLTLGSSFGFHDTPSFIIVNSKDGSNPEILKGAHPFPSFKAIIDKKLKYYHYYYIYYPFPLELYFPVLDIWPWQ